MGEERRERARLEAAAGRGLRPGPCLPGRPARAARARPGRPGRAAGGPRRAAAGAAAGPTQGGGGPARARPPGGGATRGPRPGRPLAPREVVAELAAAAEPGVVATAGGRYFGFVVGGATPA